MGETKLAPFAHTPGPWQVGYWSGRCNIAAHAMGKHPGPPECVYDHVFYPMEINGTFAGIASTEPGVTVVTTSYDELVMRMADALLIAAAPELLAALKALVEQAQDDVDDRRLSPEVQAALDAIAKAEGRT